MKLYLYLGNRGKDWPEKNMFVNTFSMCFSLLTTGCLPTLVETLSSNLFGHPLTLTFPSLVIGVYYETTKYVRVSLGKLFHSRCCVYKHSVALEIHFL